MLRKSVRLIDLESVFTSNKKFSGLLFVLELLWQKKMSLLKKKILRTKTRKTYVDDVQLFLISFPTKY